MCAEHSLLRESLQRSVSVCVGTALWFPALGVGWEELLPAFSFLFFSRVDHLYVDLFVFVFFATPGSQRSILKLLFSTAKLIGKMKWMGSSIIDLYKMGAELKLW